MSFLTDAELFTLTKRVRPSARMRVLRKQHIAFKLDGNGAPVVAWTSVNAATGRAAKKSGPNIGYFRNKRASGSSSEDRA